MKQIQESRRALHIETRGEAIVVSPEGVCDLECTRALEGIIGQIDDGTRKNIVLDASHLKYIETPGFRWIVDRFRKLQELGGSLVIAGLAGPAERAFKLLQLDKFIPAAATVEAALARIRRPAKNDDP